MTNKFNAREYAERMRSVLYPQRSAYYTHFLYKNGKLEKTVEGELGDIDTKKYGAYERIFDEERYKADRQASIAKSNEIENEFKQCLFEYLGIENHPKRHALYSLAYEYGHGSGMEEVCSHAESLAELLVD